MIELAMRAAPASTRMRIDWFRVIIDLERSGLTQRQIGDAVGRGQQQINNYKCFEGMEPRFHVGMLMLGLWSERMPPGSKVPEREA